MMDAIDHVTSFSDLASSGEQWLNLEYLADRVSVNLETILLDPIPVNPPDQVDICIFHAPCSDGSASAFVLSRYFEGACSFYGVNRGSGDTDKYLPSGVAGKHVLLVDYVYSESLMCELIDVCASVTVIDHHVSEVALIEKLGFSIFNLDSTELLQNYESGKRLQAVYSSKVSACIITWNLFFPAVPVPLLFKYINDNDVGDWKLDNIGNFIAGFSVDSAVLRPGWSEWTHFQPFAEYIKAGADFVRSRIVIGMIAKQIEWRDVYAEAQRSADRRLKVAPSLLCRVLNVTQTASSGLLFKSLLSGDYLYDDSWEPRPPADIALHYYFIDSNGSWKCSLRSASENINVGDIASKLGGGGHACAASFTLYGDLDDLFIPQDWSPDSHSFYF